MSEATKDVSEDVMRRIRRHLLTTRLMGIAVFLFITGMVASRGGSQGGVGANLAVAGEGIFVFALVYGLVSTFVNLRCPACGASLGMVLSSLYAPFGPPDDWAPACRGCGAKLLPPNERAHARAQFFRMIVGMVVIPAAAIGLGLVLR
jgi:hypothetical protein